MAGSSTPALGLLAACSSTGTETSTPQDSATITTTATSNDVMLGPSATVDLSRCEMPDPVDQVIDVDSDVFAAIDRVSVHFTPCTVDQPIPSPIVYLLHGASADETQWPDVDIFTAADRAVMNGTMPPSILVAPAAAGAYSCGECAGGLFTHLVDEIEPAVQRTAPADPGRRAIGGISQGGGLAIRVAGFAPEKFVAVGAHSAVAAPDEALNAIARADLPVRLDVGDHDGLAGASNAMSAFLDAAGARSELVIAPGRHNRAYWRSQADAYIAFYAPQLR